MFASIIAIITGFLQAIPIFAKWFPPKSEAQKEQEVEGTVDDQIKKIETTGRP